MSPRQSPATMHELQRVALLQGLGGDDLGRLAARMEREQVAAGHAIVAEGEESDRFYVVLAGMLTVSQEALGARRVLRPGDYFGEVAAATGVPRTASVRALTPSTVASCDRATFEELVKPLFSS
ncbi:MAG TPA: cyclic nucleotide-binding domain-containing protein [Gaiellaceae bacterium]|nr:cyclic nucleotide-binding domain-containing protein [Gaiellaceae bacterium]